MSQAIFYGTYQHRVDPQGRVSIPSRFRDHFRGGIVLTQGYDPCILIYSLDRWQEVSHPIASRPMTQERARVLMRVTFASAYADSLDRQGRVLVPQHLRRYAGIGESAVFAGVGYSLELWSQERWEQQQTQMEERAWQIAEGTEEWR